MNNVAEFGIQLIEGLSKKFKEQYHDLETKKSHLGEDIESEIKKRIDIAQEITKKNTAMENVREEINATKENLDKIMLSTEYDNQKEEFESLRQLLIERIGEMQKLQEKKAALVNEEKSSIKKIVELERDLEDIQSKIPVNPYEEVLAIIENNEQVRKVFSETSRILELLRDVNTELEIDVVPYDYDDIPDFEITMISINNKKIKTEKTHLRTEVESCNGEIHWRHEIVTPTLNFDTSKEVRDVFKLNPKQEISIETVLSSNNERKIKSIFLKNKRTTKPITEDYIKISAKDICIDEDETELNFLGLDISFSEYPYSI